MATLVLTAVGAAVGGPIGSAIGAIIGQQIDQRIFAPKGRKGPRLGELAVQTSAYGSAIPKMFGSIRVAGTVIWATDIKEDRHKSGGGKGKPKTTSYSYSASFAVALSGRPIGGVGRIWADGKLLRGAGGDFKSETGYRLYRGGEEQAPDPLIASIEGLAETPAYRGLAYAVFEDFELADYGNRIPSLTFEVEADPGPVTIGMIARALSGGAVADGGTFAVDGYAAAGDSIRAAIEALADVASSAVMEEGGQLLLRSGGGAALEVPVSAHGARGHGDAGGATEIVRRAGGVPSEATIGHYDPGRDYQAGLQRAFDGRAGLMADRTEVPAALSAAAAKGLAERRLAALSAARATAKLHLSWRWAGVRAGRLVRPEGLPGLWRVSRWTLDRMVTSLDLVRVPTEPAPLPPATSGRPIVQPDLLHGPTMLRLFDLPPLGEQLPEAPLVAAAAAGAEPGWRRAVLSVSLDGGASWQAAGATAGIATMGVAVTVLAQAGPAVFDTINSVEIELLSPGMWLESRSDEALVGGGNLALLGDELVQFGVATAVGERRFRLSRLLRGRRGTEWAAGSHLPGEGFTLIEAEALAPIDLAAAAVGTELRLRASGLGDSGEGAEATAIVEGEALRPPSPVHLRAVESPDGGVAISWVRRGRSGWTWLSGSDTPLGEEAEAYAVSIVGPGFTRTHIVGAPLFDYSAGDRAADGGPIAIEVVQIGTRGSSRPSRLVLG